MHGVEKGHKVMSNNIEIYNLLKEYIEEYPAFRSKPIGAPHSLKRMEQERQIALEDKALKALGLTLHR